MKKKSKSQKALNEGGFSLLVLRTLRYIRRELLPSRIASLIRYLEIIFTEKSISFPVSEGWELVEFPSFERRRVPEIFTSGSGGDAHCTKGHQKAQVDAYTDKGFVEVEDEDIVVDVGAYVGGFTIAVADKAGKVISIDPNSAEKDYLNFNTRNLENVDVAPKAAWHSEGHIELNLSKFWNDNSIFSVDDNPNGQKFEVKADTVANIAKEKGYSTVDFLKVEAEGAEPEIVSGIKEENFRVNKIAVNTGPERGKNYYTGGKIYIGGRRIRNQNILC